MMEKREWLFGELDKVDFRQELGFCPKLDIPHLSHSVRTMLQLPVLPETQLHIPRWGEGRSQKYKRSTFKRLKPSSDKQKWEDII